MQRRTRHHTDDAIHADGLSKTYPGGVEAVRGITFSATAGEVFGLLGPNGAGKSTTVGMLTTTVRPTSGTARLMGHDVALDPIAARQVSAVVFQEPTVDLALTGRRNLEIHGRLWGVDSTALASVIDDVLDAFGLTDVAGRPVETFSGGQRRRLEIARALVSSPQVLFLDEPTVGLDPRIRFELLDLIAGLRERSETTVLLTTHYLDEAERLCDRVAIVHEGRIVALDTPARLLADLGDHLVELRVDGDASGALAKLRARGLAGDDAFTVGATLTVPIHGRSARQAVAAIAELDLAVGGISARPPTLDDCASPATGWPPDRLTA